MDARLQNIESQLAKVGGHHQVHASALSKQANFEGMQIDQPTINQNEDQPGLVNAA